MTEDPKRVDPFLPLPHLEFQVLVCLSAGARHGYGIVKEVRERYGPESVPSTGSLYLAIARLDEHGLVRETEGPDDADGRRRYYGITRLGRQVAEAEARRLGELTTLVHERLDTATSTDGGGGGG